LLAWNFLQARCAAVSESFSSPMSNGHSPDEPQFASSSCSRNVSLQISGMDLCVPDAFANPVSNARPVKEPESTNSS